MALESGTHWGCILRVNVDQAIKQEGWKCEGQCCGCNAGVFMDEFCQ